MKYSTGTKFKGISGFALGMEWIKIGKQMKCVESTMHQWVPGKLYDCDNNSEVNSVYWKVIPAKEITNQYDVCDYKFIVDKAKK